MAEIMLVIGSEGRTVDGKLPGYVKSVIVDRGSRTVTHLVIEPEGREGLARLVPLDDRVDAHEGKIRLGYTEAEFQNLAAAEEILADVSESGPVELVSQGWRQSDRRAGRGRRPDLAGSRAIHLGRGPRSCPPPGRGGGTPR